MGEIIAANFSRGTIASSDKGGILKIAAINEKRFVDGGLLMEVGYYAFQSLHPELAGRCAEAEYELNGVPGRCKVADLPSGAKVKGVYSPSRYAGVDSPTDPLPPPVFQPLSGLPDEDSIRYAIDGAVTHAVGANSEIYELMAFADLVLGDPKEQFKLFKEACLSRFKLDQRGINDKYLFDMYKAEITRRTTHTVNDVHNIYSRYQGFYYWLERSEYRKNDNEKEGLEKLKSLVPSINDAEKDHLKALDKMTVMLKNKRKDVDDFLYAIRSMDSIKFTGRNKIVCIVEEIGDYKDRSLKVHYGMPPKEFLEAYRQRVGEYKLIK